MNRGCKREEGGVCEGESGQEIGAGRGLEKEDGEENEGNSEQHILCQGQLVYS